MKRNQDNDTHAVMYRPSREPFDTYPTENAARQAMQAGDYRTGSDASPEDVCLATWDNVRGWIENKATPDDRERGPWPWTLETLTNADATAEAERHAAQERKREQREELQRRAAAPLTARHAAHLAQGVLFAMDESLFSGRSAERAIA